MRGFVTYPVRSVLRNRRASASALVGLVLGVAVVAAPWVALDSSLRGVLDYHLSGLPVDAFASGPMSSLEQVVDALRQVDHAERVEPLVYWEVGFNRTASGLPSSSSPYVLAYFVDPSFETVAPHLSVQGLSVPPSGGVAVHESLRAQGLDVGETVVLERRVSRFGANGSYEGDDVYTANYTVSGYFRTTGIAEFGTADRVPIYLPLSEVPSVRARFNVTESVMVVYALIWVEREALLNPFDPAGTVARLTRQRILMQNAVSGLGFFVDYAHSSRGGGSLIDIASSLESGSLFLRILFFAFAIPTLLIAWLLSKVGFEIGASTRRRELAVLRARGLSRRGVKALLLGEATVLAAMAAALGLLLAIALSRFFFVPAGPGGAPVMPGDVAISVGTALLAFLFALLLSVGGSRGATRWLADQDLVAGLKAYHAEEASVPHRPSRDFLLGAIGAAGILLLLAWGSVKDSPLSALSFILGISTAILAPLAPFLLMIALVRYLTRGTTAPYRALARVLRRWLGDLHDLVEKNLVRAPRRSSNATAIVTFVVGLVVGVTVLSASADAYRIEGVRQQTPSDVVAETYGFAVPNTNRLNTSNQVAVEAITGVASVCVVIVTYGNFGQTVLFNASTYLRTVPWLRSELVGSDPEALMEELRQGGAFAATNGFQGFTGLQVGDLVSLGPLLDVEVSARFAAAVRGLPGLYWSFPGEEPYSSIVYVDAPSLGPTLNLSQAIQGRYLIALEPGANSTAVRVAIEALFTGPMDVRTFDEAIAMDASNAVTTATFLYLRVQANIAIVLLGVTVGLFVFSAFAERRDEFATLIARGAGMKVVIRLLMAEGWVVSVLGIVLGVVAGFATVTMIFALVSTISQTPIPLIVPLTLAIPLLAIVVAVWLASLLGALAIRRMDVPRVLKLRGG